MIKITDSAAAQIRVANNNLDNRVLVSNAAGVVTAARAQATRAVAGSPRRRCRRNRSAETTLRSGRPDTAAGNRERRKARRAGVPPVRTEGTQSG